MPRIRIPYFDNSIINPICQTATYFFKSTKEVIDYHDGISKVGRYARYDNPSWLEVEEKLASLDKSESALLFPSGMSAITTALLTILCHGDKLIFTGKGYRNIRSLCYDIIAKYGINVATLPLPNNEDFYDILLKEYSSNLKAVFIECPSNPHTFLVNLEKVREIVGRTCVIIVDSTFSSPINFRPIEFGADLVIHSCGKYIGGHADLMAGSIAGKLDLIKLIKKTRDIVGSIPDAHTAFLLNRSLSTLSMRMDVINSSGRKLAEFLSKNKKIGTVYYTGLQEHPHYNLGQKYLKGHGGVVTFEVLSDVSLVSKIVDSTNIPFMGTNFGSSHSMIEQLSIFTYYKQSYQEKTDLGIKDNLIRYSVGFDDDVDRIISDLDQAINKCINV